MSPCTSYGTSGAYWSCILWATQEKGNTNKKGEYLGKGVALSSCTKHVCNSVKNNLYNPCWNFEEVLTLGIDGTGPDLYV